MTCTRVHLSTYGNIVNIHPTIAVLCTRVKQRD
jgi:hypothetical protein